MRFVKRRRGGVLWRVRSAPAAVFAVAFAVYFALGYLVVVRWHVVVGDALSRLAHAYFVWFNAPPKLAAVGFVWPPLLTIVLLPFAAIPPLATSLVALPLASALFGAATVVTLERTLALVGLGTRLRLALLPFVALQPMFVFYAVNGMGEIVSLFLLTFATYAFVRWYLAPGVGSLVLTSVTLALAVVSRYEMGLWALLYAVAIVAILIRRRSARTQVEGTVVTFLAPIAYTLALWIFFNWLILGDPLHWLHSEVSLTFTAVRESAPAPVDTSLATATDEALRLLWRLFPAAFVVGGALAVRFATRRDLVAGLLAGAIALNVVATIVLVVGTHTNDVLQLRYNIRPIPLVLVGIGWLWHGARDRRTRAAIAVLGAAALAASAVPMTHLMRTYPRQYQEQAFIRALTSLSDQEGTASIGSRGPIQVGVAPERAAADWIVEHTRRQDSVLADDERAFGVILFTGRPSLFLDRIDRGDAAWLDVLDRPQGTVDFVLVRRSSLLPDLIQERYPTVLDGGVPWLRQVYSNADWRIYRVLPRNT